MERDLKKVESNAKLIQTLDFQVKLKNDAKQAEKINNRYQLIENTKAIQEFNIAEERAA